MTEADIQKRLMYAWHVQSMLCTTGMFLWEGFECDFARVTRASYLYEYEIKVTRPDFLADFKKKAGRLGPTKHEMIQEGRSPLKYFSFVSPKGVLKQEDIPERYGWYEVNDEKYYYNSLERRVRPKVLPNAKPLSQEEILKIALKVCNRWVYDKFFRPKDE